MQNAKDIDRIRRLKDALKNFPTDTEVSNVLKRDTERLSNVLDNFIKARDDAAKAAEAKQAARFADADKLTMNEILKMLGEEDPERAFEEYVAKRDGVEVKPTTPRTTPPPAQKPATSTPAPARKKPMPKVKTGGPVTRTYAKAVQAFTKAWTSPPALAGGGTEAEKVANATRAFLLSPPIQEVLNLFAGTLP